MNTIERLKREKTPIIYGAGIVGEVLYRACQDAGIKVECFCDNDINKTAKPLEGLEVIHTPSLKDRYQDAVFLISAADIRDVLTQLQYLGYSDFHSCNEILRNIDLSKHEFRLPSDFVEYAVATAIQCHDSFLTPDKLFLRSVDIVITERCSLRCRDCSNLMRYYKNPQDCNFEDLMQDIGNFCDTIDEVNEFRVLGGEPFMNKKAHLVIKRLIDENKVKKVVIYTNGTIAPKDEQIEYFKSEKVLFIITDYGELSRNLTALADKLSSNNISFYVQKVGSWTDCAQIAKHNRSQEGLKTLFDNCCAKNVITLSDGKLYRCPFSANTARLHAVPFFEQDFVSIQKTSIDETKNNIRKFLLEKGYLETCDFCNGRSFGDPHIQPAVQQAKPIEYKQYY